MIITDYSAIDNSYIIKKDVINESANVLLTFDKLPELIYLKDYLKALSSSKIYILSLLEFYRELLSSIDLLVCSSIIHNNLGFDSIYKNNNEGNVLISDFSVAIDVSRPDIGDYIKHFILEYCPEYINWTPEFHILAYLLTNKLETLSYSNIETVINDIISKNYILNIFGPELVSSYKVEAIEYFKKYVNMSYNNIVSDILKNYWSFDNYALSIMYLKILINLHRSTQLSTKKDNKFIILFMKLLVNNIHLNPLKRLSLNVTSTNFESILDNLDRQVWMDLI
jgi:hypothetical protein